MATELTGQALADALAKISPTGASASSILAAGNAATGTGNLTGDALASALSQISPTQTSAANISSRARIIQANNARAAQAAAAQKTTPTPVVPATVPPTNVADINQIKSATYTNNNLPTFNPITGDISNAVASVNSTQAKIDATIQANQDALAAKQEADKLQATKDQASQGILSYLSSQPTVEQTRVNAYQQTGINPGQYFADQRAGIAKINSLAQDYNATVAARDAQIAATQDKMGSMNFINNQVAQINRNAAPLLNQKSANINAEAAALQAQQGNFAEAQNFVNQAVADATATKKDVVDSYNAFASIYQDSIDRLNKVYQSALDSASAQAKAEYDQAQADKKSVGAMIIASPGAGITINDTLDEAYAKYSSYASSQGTEVKTQIVEETGADGVNRKFLINSQTGEIIRKYDDMLGIGSGDTTNLSPTQIKAQATFSDRYQKSAATLAGVGVNIDSSTLQDDIQKALDSGKLSEETAKSLATNAFAVDNYLTPRAPNDNNLETRLTEQSWLGRIKQWWNEGVKGQAYLASKITDQVKTVKDAQNSLGSQTTTSATADYTVNGVVYSRGADGLYYAK